MAVLYPLVPPTPEPLWYVLSPVTHGTSHFRVLLLFQMSESHSAGRVCGVAL